MSPALKSPPASVAPASPDPVSAALQIWSNTFCQSFDALPAAVREAVE